MDDAAPLSPTGSNGAMMLHMPVKVMCMACGKSLVVEDADLGQTVMCRACGKSIELHRTSPPQVQAIQAQGQDDDGWASALQSSGGAALGRTKGTIGRGALHLFIAGFCLATVLVALMVLMLTRLPSHGLASSNQLSGQTQKQQETRLRAIKSEAEALAAAGHFDESAVAYGQLARAAAAQPTDDPALREELIQAAVDRQRVEQIISSRGHDPEPPDMRPRNSGYDARRRHSAGTCHANDCPCGS